MRGTRRDGLWSHPVSTRDCRICPHGRRSAACGRRRWWRALRRTAGIRIRRVVHRPFWGDSLLRRAATSCTCPDPSVRPSARCQVGVCGNCSNGPRELSFGVTSATRGLHVLTRTMSRLSCRGRLRLFNGVPELSGVRHRPVASSLPGSAKAQGAFNWQGLPCGLHHETDFDRPHAQRRWELRMMLPAVTLNSY